MLAWLFLLGAIFFEVVATTNIKLSHGYSRLWPSIIVVVGYVLSFWLISLAMKTVPLNIAYPVWAGLGTALIVVSGSVIFHESLTPVRLAGILIVLAGVIILNLSGVHRFEG